MPENNTSKFPYGWLVVLISIIVFAVVLMIFYGKGQTSGIEFSPDDFSRRSFSYNQTPLLKWVIRKKTFADRTTDLEKHLTLDGFVPTVVNRTKTWHLIKDSGSNAKFASDQCDARFLTNYLDLTNDDGDDYWTIWTADFPKSAKIFWPRVADFARDEMYLKIPDVMQLAMDITSDKPGRFEAALNQLLSEAYLEMGEIDLGLERLERAKTRLQKASDLGDDDTSSRANDLLTQCESKLGSQTTSIIEEDETSDNVEASEE
jgi:hypothetical protein